MVELIDRIADSYRRPKEWEVKWYEKLGVKVAKRLVTNVFSPPKKQSNYFLKKPTADGAKSYQQYTFRNEVIHEIGTVGAIAEMYLLFSTNRPIVALIMGGIALSSTELVFIQRYNRARIQRILNQVNLRQTGDLK